MRSVGHRERNSVWFHSESRKQMNQQTKCREQTDSGGGVGWGGRSGLPGRAGLAHCIFKANKCPQTSVPIRRRAEKAAWPPPLSRASGDRPRTVRSPEAAEPPRLGEQHGFLLASRIPDRPRCFRLLGCWSARRSRAAGSHSCVSLRMLPTGQRTGSRIRTCDSPALP